MDCLEAQAIVSAQRDGEVISADVLKAAVEHCAECADCAAFDSGLKWLSVMPVPSAPAGLVDSVMGAVALVAADRAEAERLEAERIEAERLEAEAIDAGEAPETAPVPVQEAPAQARWLGEVPASWVDTVASSRAGTAVSRWFATVPAPARWAGLGAIATVAATALIAFVVLGGRPGAETSGVQDAATGRASDSVASAPSPLYGGTPGSGAPTSGSAAAEKAPEKAPDYVLFRGVVFAPAALLADASSATPTIGTVNTAFASSGGPQDVPVYKSPLSDGSIVVQGPDGLRVYTPVVRMLSSLRYQLTAGNTLDRFGVWPTLLTRFTTPTDPNGGPSFVPAGVDALGVNVYAAAGRPVNEGFAVAPGTSASDPAGGNPNWTWWSLMRNQAE